ncbi:diguanylate cyclase (GGDEF) domain-containing protein [Ruminococcus sp. YE71]|uniref:diguanylate cyclase n=1 Tax=unclassified Ruminococcus TaxID=2608920 RepID=UPI0008878DE0|nr:MULTISPECIES: GGDEF domain-containing protein [unclassified Ruminococcus]SDA17312.1 diguanylate cyclase (GGDEF) domain-containing protein [Ruminococcus sp. YE78]SFW26654.1 diguanylate cyclase (GGDEF) domain-containing protein [Ruminococcus sp. YE71]
MKDGKKVISICTSRIFDAQQHIFLKLLSRKLSAESALVMIFCTNTDLYWEEEKYFPEAAVFEFVPFDITDVLIIMDEKIKSKNVSEELISKARENDTPVIVVDGEYENTCRIRFDYEKGFENIVRHMIVDHGVKNPLFMAGFRGNVFSEQRIAVFKKVIAENGIPFSEDMICYGDFWAAPARAAMQDALDRGIRPDAVICANDIMAINICDVLIKNGFRVPEDVRVSGFDGIDEASFCSPRISTASCGSDLLADTVYNCVSNCLKGIIHDEVPVLPQLMPNESCGCCTSIEQPLSILSRFNNSFYRYQDDIRIMYEITTAVQMSSDPQKAADCLTHTMMADTHCFTYSSCLEIERDYFSSPIMTSEKSKFRAFYDPDSPFPSPDFGEDELGSRLAALVRPGYPMIVNALDYLGKPMGFICHRFANYDIVNYAKTASITNTVSMGLGGFIISRYQRYLLDKVEEMYSTDSLTGLFNRSGFNAEFEKLLEDESFGHRPVTVLMADLDGLKFINDTYGHEAGDNAIKRAADALKNSCPEGSLCVRFGGDEMFAVIIGACDPESIIGSIERALDEANARQPCECKTSLSCGAFTTTLGKRFDLSSALKKADERMYRNKRSRKMKFTNI